MFQQLTPHAAWFLGGIFALLILASVWVIVLKYRRPERDDAELVARIRSWWVMIGMFAVAISWSFTASLVFLASVSFLAFKEYVSLIPTRRTDRRVLFWAYLAIPVQYAWVAMAWYGMFVIFIPVYLFLWLPMRMVLIGDTAGFLRAAGTLHWGLMLTVFNLSHLAYLLVLPEATNPLGGNAGLLLFLMFLTQFNDVAQYVWGKALGRHPVIPKVSPKKTWEGLVGGVLTTTLLAGLLAPWLTPLAGWEAPAAGLLIGLSGFVGDVNLSALKRDLGVKDSGRLIPGHGGILDRVDSLTTAAPLFFHTLYYLHY